MIFISQLSIIKKEKLISLWMVCSLLIWLTLLFLKIFLNYKTSFYCQNFEFAIDIINIVLVYLICFNIKLNNKIIFYLGMSVICFFLLDILYFIVYSVPHIWSYVFVFDIVHFLYYFVTLTFFTKILLNHVLQWRQFIVILFISILIDIAIFTIFSIEFSYIFESFSLRHLIQFIQSFIDLLVFNLAIICLVYSKKTGVLLALSGYIILTSSEFMMTSCYLSNITILLDYCELLWLLGLILIMYGMLLIIINKNYIINSWFRPQAAIKNQLIFWGFGFAFLSFIFVFIIMKKFSIINEMFFIFFPTIIMNYSLIIVFISILIGNVLEHPFKKLRKNIEYLLINNDKAKIDSNFSIEEFNFLQEYLMKAFEFREEKNKMEKRFGEIATRMAHDIGSPLSAMGTVVSNLKKIGIAKDDINLLEMCMSNIKNITYTVLKSYRKLTDAQINNNIILEDNITSPFYIILSRLIEDVISNKYIEWNKNPCNISFKNCIINNYAWIYASPIEVKRNLSNLLNNAYESLGNNERNIEIILKIIGSKILLTIQDNGSGIPPEKLSLVLAGKSLKHSGNGIGLLSAKKYIKSLNGELLLESILNKGTKISISLPYSKPNWCPNIIKYKQNSIFVVLDDDGSIHSSWQIKFKEMNIKSFHFNSAKDILNWSKTQNILNEIIFFIDFHLNDDNYNGLEIIKELNITKCVYLISNQAEDYNIQKCVENLGIYLIPKALIFHIPFLNSK